MNPDRRRTYFAIIGAVYGIGLTVWGMLVSGGGHFNLVFMLFASPAGAGILFWPLWGYLIAGAMSRGMRITFLSTVAAHYLWVIYYLFFMDNSDLYWFRIGTQQPAFGFLVLLSVALYLAGQALLWRQFMSANETTN